MFNVPQYVQDHKKKRQKKRAVIPHGGEVIYLDKRFERVRKFGSAHDRTRLISPTKEKATLVPWSSLRTLSWAKRK